MEDRFTATDALALDVEGIERWARDVVADGDAPTALLASLVVRLRTAADLLADYLFQASEPAQEGTGAGADALRRAAPNRPPCAEARGGSERERAGSPKRLREGAGRRAERPRAGNLQSPSIPPANTEGAFHE